MKRLYKITLTALIVTVGWAASGHVVASAPGVENVEAAAEEVEEQAIEAPAAAVQAPKAPKPVYAVVDSFIAETTAYTSSVDETDSTPHTSADGKRTYDGLIACPRRYPFGTLVRIAGRVYRCGDRLNARYDNRFDIWKQTKAQAFEHGRKKLKVEIVIKK